jgi:predicted membrane protein
MMMSMMTTRQCQNMSEKTKLTIVRQMREKFPNEKKKFSDRKQKMFIFINFIFLSIAVLGVNITLIFFGWILAIASVLLVYGTFKRQSRLLVPYLFALFETVLLVILLEVLPEFIDNLGVGWFLLLNLMIGKEDLKILKARKFETK